MKTRDLFFGIVGATIAVTGVVVVKVGKKAISKAVDDLVSKSIRKEEDYEEKSAFHSKNNKVEDIFGSPFGGYSRMSQVNSGLDSGFGGYRMNSGFDSEFGDYGMDSGFDKSSSAENTDSKDDSSTEFHLDDFGEE